MIEKYSELINKLPAEMNDDDKSQKMHEIAQSHLVVPVNTIQEYFKLFRILKTSHKELWSLLDQSQQIDDELKTEITSIAVTLQQTIMQSANTAPLLHNNLRILQYLRPLDQYLENRNFEEYYNKCFVKINDFNTDIDKKICDYINEQNYEEILVILK